MMKKNKIVFIYLLCLFLLSLFYSCELIPKYVTYKSYIDAFVGKESLRIIHSPDESEENSVQFRVAAHDPKVKMIAENSTGADKKQFDDLVKKYNDTSYNRKFIINDLDEIRHSNNLFIVEKITDISITSDTDWNKDYPAGASLNDIFLIFSCSPDTYISNGYKIITPTNPVTVSMIDERLRGLLSAINISSGGTTTPIYGTLSTIEFEKYNLLGISGIIGWFASTISPDNPNINIKVTIKFDDGKIIELQDS